MGREKGGKGAKLRIASPFAREKGRMRVDSCVCRIQTSKPLTITSPLRKGRGEKLQTPENVAVVRHHPALSNVVLFARRDFSKPDRR